MPVGDAAAQTARGVTPVVFAREELNMGADTVIANSQRPVLEYLAHIDYVATMNTAAAGVTIPIVAEGLDNTSGGNAAALNTNPHRGYALRVQLSGRVGGVDPTFEWRGTRANFRAPLLSYLPRLPGSMTAANAVGVAPASRVRTAEEVIRLDNIVARAEELP